MDRLTESLRGELPGYGLDVAIDASDMAAYANGQRYVSKGGREREAQTLARRRAVPLAAEVSRTSRRKEPRACSSP